MRQDHDNSITGFHKTARHIWAFGIVLLFLTYAAIVYFQWEDEPTSASFQSEDGPADPRKDSPSNTLKKPVKSPPLQTKSSQNKTNQPQTSFNNSEGSTANVAQPQTPKKPQKKQPRTFLTLDFSDSELPPGETQNIAQNGGGLALSTQATASNPRRVGTFVSDPILLDFPFNAISPLWKAETPEGTQVSIKLSLSADGREWTSFFESEADSDGQENMSATYPNGRPNPHYGFTPGGILTFGLSLFTHLRYSVTLSSSVPENPELLALRLYYQDTTLGKGKLATLPTPNK